MDRTLRTLQKRLERLELEHLRQHALELHERLEAAEERGSSADERAEYWRESFMTMQEAAFDDEFATHRSVGLSQAGELMVVRNDA